MRSAPTITSRAGGHGGVARANAAIRSGSRRRLKIDPTKSTSGSRLASVRPAGDRVRHAGRDDADAAGIDAEARLRAPRRENSESVKTTAARRGGAPGQPAAAQAFARPEPLRVGGERDVVNRHRERHAEAERRRVGRREEDVGPVARHRAAQRRLLPPRAAAAGRRSRELGRARREVRAAAAPACRGRTAAWPASGRAVQRAQQLAEIAADAGRVARAARARRRRCAAAASRASTGRLATSDRGAVGVVEAGGARVPA